MLATIAVFFLQLFLQLRCDLFRCCHQAFINIEIHIFDEIVNDLYRNSVDSGFQLHIVIRLERRDDARTLISDQSAAIRFGEFVQSGHNGQGQCSLIDHFSCLTLHDTGSVK